MQFTNSLGQKIAAYCWEAAGEPKGILLLVHDLDGHAESEFSVRPGLRYKGSWIEHFNRLGYECWSWDHSGMGRSEGVVEGKRSMIYSFDEYVTDALHLRQIVGQMQDKLPVGIVGQRMGATIALRAAELRPKEFSAVVALAPAVRFEKMKAFHLFFFELHVLAILSAALPWLPLPVQVAVPDAELDEEARRISLPLFNHGKGEPNWPGWGIRARVAYDAIRVGELVVEEAARLTMPVLVLHCPEDPHLDYSGPEMLRNRAGDCTLLPHENAVQSLVHCTDSAALCKKVSEWLGPKLGLEAGSGQARA